MFFALESGDSTQTPSLERVSPTCPHPSPPHLHKNIIPGRSTPKTARHQHGGLEARPGRRHLGGLFLRDIIIGVVSIV